MIIQYEKIPGTRCAPGIIQRLSSPSLESFFAFLIILSLTGFLADGRGRNAGFFREKIIKIVANDGLRFLGRGPRRNVPKIVVIVVDTYRLIAAFQAEGDDGFADFEHNSVCRFVILGRSFIVDEKKYGCEEDGGKDDCGDDGILFHDEPFRGKFPTIGVKGDGPSAA